MRMAGSSLTDKCLFALCLSLPFVLYLIPRHWIYEGHSICLFRNLFGIECWGCGMTRALFSVLDLHFTEAWNYNSAIVIVIPMLIWLWGRELHRLYRAARKD